MKRYLVSLLALLCLVALPAAGQQTATVKVNANSVNLRKAASVDSGIVQALAKGTLLTVLSREGNWIKVQVQGQTASGWVRSDLVDAVPASAAAAAAPPAVKAGAAPTPASTAKDDGYRGGLTLFGGITSFSIKATPLPSTGLTFGNATGIAAGIGFIAHLGGPIGLELDGDFVQDGAETTYTSGATTIEGTVHDNNVGGALLLRPAFGSGPVRGFLQGGASFAYTINCSESASTGTAMPCTIDSSEPRSDVALVLGAGASYSMLALQVRYHIGLSNETNIPGYTVKSNGLLVLLSVILPHARHE
jgi:uncharacterized protein YgiM (DUF1202 family)